jgi:uncharacterized membrane protein (DUF373 family)
MSGHHHHHETKDPKLNERMQKAAHRDRWSDHIFRRILHVIERFIAVLTIMALLAALIMEIYTMIQDLSYFEDVHHMLHNLLTIVVGLEFVRMLIDTTPANILEVLTVAITRHVVLTHEDPWSNIASVACIAGLFAIRRYLIRRHELKEEMVEEE